MAASRSAGTGPDGRTSVLSGFALMVVPFAMAASHSVGFASHASPITGVLWFGALFAINSAVHSYLIVAFADADGVTLDVGFYYMSSAVGRLFGTFLSGPIQPAYQVNELLIYLLISVTTVALATLISRALP